METLARLALAADDPRLLASIQAQLKAAFGREAPASDLEAVRAHPPRRPGSLLLLAAGSPVESDRILRLVQEIYLRKLPPVLLLIEAGTPGPGRGLAGLAPYVAARLRWPEQAGQLVQLLRDRLRDTRLQRTGVFGRRRRGNPTPRPGAVAAAVDRPPRLGGRIRRYGAFDRRDRHRQDASRPSAARLLATGSAAFPRRALRCHPCHSRRERVFRPRSRGVHRRHRSQDRQVRGRR